MLARLGERPFYKGVGGDMEHINIVECSSWQRRELRCRPPIGEERTLARCVDNHDDRAGRSNSYDGLFDMTIGEALQ